MKINFSKIGRLSAVALMATPILTAFGGSSVFAAPAAGTGEGGNNSSGRVIANGSQSVTAGTIAQPGTPATATSLTAIEFYAGNLSLDRVPQFDFGTHQLQENSFYNLYSSAPILASDYTNITDPRNSAANELNYYRVLQVTDKTGGTQGWTVTAWAEPFVQQGGSVQMHPTDIRLNTTKIDRQVKNIPDPSSSGQFLTTYEESPSTDEDRPGNIVADNLSKAGIIDFAPTTGSTPSNVDVNPIFGVGAGTTSTGIAKGKGTWAADFNDPSSATLNLPLSEQSTIGIFKSTIHWSLQAGVVTSRHIP